MPGKKIEVCILSIDEFLFNGRIHLPAWKIEFNNSQTAQTVIGNLAEIKAIQSVKNVYSEGAFVVVKACESKQN